MNKKQIVVMWMAIIIIVAMVVYPPWFRIVKYSSNSVYSYEYNFIWEKTKYRLDIYRLAIQVATVGIVTGGFMLTPSGSFGWLTRYPKRVIKGIFSDTVLNVLVVISIAAFLVCVIIMFLKNRRIWP